MYTSSESIMNYFVLWVEFICGTFQINSFQLKHSLSDFCRVVSNVFFCWRAQNRAAVSIFVVWGGGKDKRKHFVVSHCCRFIVFCSYQTGNTVSNLIMILPPICGAVQTFRNGLERRYIFSFLGLAGQMDFLVLSFRLYQQEKDSTRWNSLSRSCGRRFLVLSHDAALWDAGSLHFELVDEFNCNIAARCVCRCFIVNCVFLTVFFQLLDELPMIYSTCIFVYCL